MLVTPITMTAPDNRQLSLTLGREYEVLGIEGDYYRILSDEEATPYGNDPVLYEPECFSITDPREPDFWICKIGEDGERYCYPPEWSEPGFFEDYHDGKEEVRSVFWRGVKCYYPKTWLERTHNHGTTGNPIT